MTRIKRGVTASKRRKAVIKRAKGYRGARSKKYRAAKEATIKAGSRAFAGRKQRKRDIRRTWNIRINARTRKNDMTYSVFIKALKDHKIDLNRKMLADFAANHPEVFDALVKEVAKPPSPKKTKAKS